MKRKREESVSEEEPPNKIRKLRSRIDEICDKYKRTKFDLTHVLKFFKKCDFNNSFVHFDLNEALSRDSIVIETKLYLDDKSGKPGFYCSLFKLKGELFRCGYSSLKKYLIPSKRIKSFSDLANSMKHLNEYYGEDFHPSILEEEEKEHSWKMLEIEECNKDLFLKSLSQKYRNKKFLLIGVWKLFQDSNLDFKYVHFNEFEVKNKPTRLYFDESTDDPGFFCDFEDIKLMRKKKHDKVDRTQIPSRILCYSDLIECIKYIWLCDKVEKIKKSEKEGGDDYKPPSESSSDDESEVRHREVEENGENFIIIDDSDSDDDEEHI